jgi:transposase
MTEVITIGLDLAKNVFQVHGVDGLGEVTIRRQLRRRQVIPFFGKLAPCLIGVEACPTSHYWSRELQALGHEVRIMPAGYVKPYVKRNKNDAADAAAICEAVTRPTMRFVAVKTAEQQSLMMLHRTRSLLIRQRTMLVNAIRAHLAEFGIVAPVGLRGVKRLVSVVSDPTDERLPSLARICLGSLIASLTTVEWEASCNKRRILAWHRSSEASRRLETIPGIGPIIATALVASVSDPSIFESGRELAAWIGLVPKQNSTGGKERMGRISKQGDKYLRWLLVTGAMSVIRHGRKTNFENNPWLADLVHRKPTKVAAVALANKIARIAWAVLVTGEPYRQPAPVKV